MVNGAAGPDEARLGWSRQLWNLLLYLFAILAFLATPLESSRKTARTFLALRVIGFAGLLFLAILYRDKNGHILQPQWWGILGLIGWAYLIASIGYLVLLRREWLASATFILIALFMFDHTNFFAQPFAAAHLPLLHWLRNYIDFGEVFGSHGAIAMAGVFLGATLIDPQISSPMQRIRIALVWGALLAVAAGCVYPLYGINKNDATPAWALICASATCLLWVALSLLMDVGGVSHPLRLFTAGGQNVLLAYLLMPLFLYFIWWRGYSFYGQIGRYSLAGGITRSLLMACLVLYLAGLLKDRGVRLRL